MSYVCVFMWECTAPMGRGSAGVASPAFTPCCTGHHHTHISTDAHTEDHNSTHQSVHVRAHIHTGATYTHQFKMDAQVHRGTCTHADTHWHKPRYTHGKEQRVIILVRAETDGRRAKLEQERDERVRATERVQDEREEQDERSVRCADHNNMIQHPTCSALVCDPQ